VIDEDDPVYAARPFGLEPDLYRYVETPIHWDCYARWEHRPRFTRQYFAANLESIRHNQYWGIARCDERVFITVNPGEYVRQVDVLLAETGSSFRIHLDEWQGWLEGEWFEACRHEAEREVLAALIPSWRESLPTAEVVVEAAGMSEAAEGRQGWLGKPGSVVERVAYEFACQDLAERTVRKGLACPRCGAFSNDYDYRKVEAVSAAGPQSRLACKSCGGEFGPSDV
jgi:hypothetical protein